MHLDARSLPRVTFAGALLLAPIANLVSTLVSPPLRSTEAASLAEVVRHPDRFYLFTFFVSIGSMLLVPALLGVMRLVRGRSPFLAYVGGALAQLGVLVAIGDSMTQLVFWQMGTPGLDRAQMATLAHRYESAPGSSLFFAVGGLALVAGLVLLAAGLWRARVAPRWTALSLPASAVLNIAGFSAHSIPLLAASCVVMLAGMGRLALPFLGGERVGVALASAV